MRTRAQLDALIDAYEKAAPGAHHEIPVAIARCSAQRFCAELDGRLSYRGQTIMPTKSTAHCGRRERG